MHQPTQILEPLVAVERTQVIARQHERQSVRSFGVGPLEGLEGQVELTEGHPGLGKVGGLGGFAVQTSENRPRRDSFARAARSSVKLLAGTIPWFVLLGVVEGVISPRHDIATGVKATLGILLLAAFLLYVLAPTATRDRGPA